MELNGTLLSFAKTSEGAVGTRQPNANGHAASIDMRTACFLVFRMLTTVQIRNVPDALHRRLKSRAALSGMSLSDYLPNELREVAERPTLEELRARLHGRSTTAPSPVPAEAVRAERDRR